LKIKQNQKDEENNASSSRVGGHPSFEHQDLPTDQQIISL